MDPIKITEEMKSNKQRRIDKAVMRQNELIKSAVEHGRHKTIVDCYDTVEDGDLFPEIKRIFEKAGYKIQPTGFIGGIRQRTMDICW